jgi:hypothetical protein
MLCAALGNKRMTGFTRTRRAGREGAAPIAVARVVRTQTTKRNKQFHHQYVDNGLHDPSSSLETSK